MRVIPHARQVRRVPHTARLVVEERRAGEVPCACWPRWACYSCWAWLWPGLSGYGPMACSSPACCWPFPSPDWWNGCVPRNGLGSCVRRISSSPWRCLHGARSCRSSPTILHGCRPSPRPEPGLGHGLRQVAAPPVSRGPRPLAVPLPMQCVRPPWLSAAARWIWVLPLIALWFARGTDRLQTLVMTLVALLGFVLGRARASSDEARRALLHAQDRARESSRAHSFAHRRHR